MASNYIQPGEVLEYTAGADITSGDVVWIGGIVGVALDNIATGAVGPVQVSGVFSIPKDQTVVFNVGDPVYWDDAAGHATAAQTAYVMGFAFADAASGVESVAVRLNTPPQSVSGGGGL